MSCMKHSPNEIDKIKRTFLWHGVSNQPKKMSLANWNLVCKPKEFGGLGIMDLKMFNQALLIEWYDQWEKPNQSL